MHILYSNLSPFLFNGKEFDEETGLYYYGARYYNPRTSLWLSVDPLTEKAPGWSPYRYCFNSPVNFIDPYGLFETRKEARQYRRNNDNVSGRIRKGDDGLYSINDKSNNVSYYKDSSLDNIKHVVGRGKDGVIQSAMATANDPNGGGIEVASKPQGYRLVQFGIAPAGNSSPFAIDGHAKENLDIGNGSRLSITEHIAGWTKRNIFKPQTNWRNTCEGDTGVYNWNYREKPGLGVTKILPWSGDTVISPIYDGITPPYWIKPPSSMDYDRYLDY